MSKRCNRCKHRETDTCKQCKDFYEKTLFEADELKDGEVLCVCCNKIVSENSIFVFAKYPKKGLCFDCY